jgi:hypothetical protein
MSWAMAEGVVETSNYQRDRCSHEEGKMNPDLMEALQRLEPMVPKVVRRLRTLVSLAVRHPEQPTPG